MEWIDTPVLDGQYVRLEPLSPRHLTLVETIALEEQTWKYMANPILDRKDLETWAKQGWEQQEAHTMMPWVTFAKFPDGSEIIAGGTRFLDINLKDSSVEIGNSWITPPLRGTKVNAEAKYLQLKFAFETFGCRRVAFKAHGSNLRSHAAIKALGAKYEGTFRDHMLMPDGSFRDTAWFSILKSEWPEVKSGLERRLAAPLP
ncbi:GNAT family N-acetyltransferase [Granulicella cerasi]|uniref:GNAT family N-acetyltransferase n=1 Tax=Granulicella cerasi TaxID=741063 RepID=A0ABW1ZFC0_9BACT|nr:GNAT family protein [Granulicella cerasi]